MEIKRTFVNKANLQRRKERFPVYRDFWMVAWWINNSVYIVQHIILPPSPETTHEF